jgi:hypothetical protein
VNDDRPRYQIRSQATKGLAAVQAYGFTARQARFLMLAVEHSGVCLPHAFGVSRYGAAFRQYRRLTGVAHGRHAHRFFERLIDGGFALRLA